MTDQAELTGIFCARPQNFVWFLGAGTSRSAGLPTATDVIWDMKRRYYCREENQEIIRQDIQNDAVRSRIQSFMDSKGFPALWADEEYTTYFEKIFGQDKERQRRYLKAFLSEDNVTLSVGHRVFGALLASGLTRIVFTTNFDTVIEKAVAEVAGRSLSAFHLEGSHAANQTLNNEEFPLYCKLHGDFRYDSIKNLSADLAAQNEELAACMVNAGTRYGFVVTGYSGRDESVMRLFYRILEAQNPFPHGLYWTAMKGSSVLPSVDRLLNDVRTRGVQAHIIEIETFDALMLRMWRNIQSKPVELDAKVRKAKLFPVSIPLPPVGRSKPLLRFNALRVLDTPCRSFALSLKTPKDWRDLRRIRNESEGRLLFTKAEEILCWGEPKLIKEAFGNELVDIVERELPSNFQDATNLHIKGFLEEALCAAVARERPLLSRSDRAGAVLIADPHAEDASALEPLTNVIEKASGLIPGLFSAVTEDHPHAEQVRWSEALRISLDMKNERLWLLFDPDVWIWPPRSRMDAIEFLDRRRGNRYNQKYNELLSAWSNIILGTDVPGKEIHFRAFDSKEGAGNPLFVIGSRTAFARGSVA